MTYSDEIRDPEERAEELTRDVMRSFGMRTDLPPDHHVSMPYTRSPKEASRLILVAIRRAERDAAERMRRRCELLAADGWVVGGNETARNIAEAICVLPLEESPPAG